MMLSSHHWGGHGIDALIAQLDAALRRAAPPALGQSLRGDFPQPVQQLDPAMRREFTRR